MVVVGGDVADEGGDFMIASECFFMIGVGFGVEEADGYLVGGADAGDCAGLDFFLVADGG